MFRRSTGRCKFERRIAALVWCCTLLAPLANGNDRPEFTKDVLPILQQYCGKCHGGDSKKAELDLTRLDGIRKGGESGEPVVVPGKSAESHLYQLLVGGEMPPKDLPRPSEAQIDLIKNWIDGGANGLGAESSEDHARNDIARKVFDTFEWKCFVCHGRREKKAELDLRTVESMLKGGKSGPALVAGEPEKSLLVKRIHADEMPPFKSRYPYSVKPVSASELDMIKRWIASGAPEPKYEVLDRTSDGITEQDRNWWSFQPPRVALAPPVHATSKAQTAIDQFVLARLEPRKLTLSAASDRRVLIRRLYDDLWGLPPSPDDVDAFLADQAPDAYKRLVDRLLASPHYGERWAQHWLDAAGFAESEGLESADPIFDEMYRYRDYVVQSLNADKPFDQFLIEQLAGDELANYREQSVLTPEAADKVVATGFLRTAMDSTREPAINFYVNRLQVIDDTVEIVSSNLLGLSLRCAKCHSHKYDPISQRDYYRFAAIFAAAYSPQDWLKPAERLLPLTTSAEQAELERHNATVNERLAERQKQLDQFNEIYLSQLRAKKVDSLPAEVREAVRTASETAVDQRTDEMKKLLASHEEKIKANVEELPNAFVDYAEGAKPLQSAVEQVKAELKVIPRVHGLTDVTPDPAPFYLLMRGDWNVRGGQVSPGVPAVLDQSPTPYVIEKPAANTTGRRLAFARWLTQPDQPLTARVFVNRVWRQYFGRGIVGTVGEFGRAGELPSHPELLDWLAIRFVQSNWSIKNLHRTIVTSAVYQQQSRVIDEPNAVDPENRLLWRMPLRRRDAESIRDSVMSIAGTLNSRMYGPSSPVETRPDGQVSTSATAAERRRSVYMLHRRLSPETILETFDAPRMSINCVERRTSTVVNQSLMLLHSQFMEEQSLRLAERARDVAGSDPSRQIDAVYQLVHSRKPDESERNRGLKFLGNHAEGESIDMLAELSLVLVNSAEFLYVD